MSELKTRPTTASVMQFLALQPDQRRADCEAVLQMIEAATGEVPQMWGDGIVGFGRYAYANSSGKAFDWPLVGFSPRKKDLTLYIMPGFDSFAGLTATMGKHKTGKSCLYLKKLSDVDTDVLRKLINGAVEAIEPHRVR